MTSIRLLRYLCFAALLLWLLVACSDSDEARKVPVGTVKASMLVQGEEAKPEWFRGIEIPTGTDAYAFTQIVTEGNMKSTFYPEYRSHFVEGIRGVENQPPHYWMIYIWNETTGKWEPLPVASDFFSVKDGHTLAWHYTDANNLESVTLLVP